MIRYLAGRHRDLYWATLALLLVLVLVADALLISREYHEVYARQRDAAKAELGFLAGLITESLTSEQYHLAELLVDSWGRQHPEAIHLSVETQDGFVLARYGGEPTGADGTDRLLLSQTITYGYAREARLKLEVDLRGAGVAVRRYTLQIVGGTVVLLALFGQLLVLLDRSRQQRVLEAWAHQDGLTGIGNRRRFEQMLEMEWRRARRSQTPLALIMADLDAFKAYNDALGHLAGDDCLRQVAAVLARQAVRPADLVARYGGEEFVVVLPDTELSSARHLAEQMRAAVEGLELAHPAAPVTGRVTLSLGVAALVPFGEVPPTELIERADRALYRAKQAGGNRVVVAAGEGPSLAVRA
ncbi:MAG: diguanylate cyclase [Lysobacteraceae bacterium]